MVRGYDESNNPKRRPKRPQTDREKMDIIKQVFPDAYEVVTPSSPPQEERTYEEFYFDDDSYSPDEYDRGKGPDDPYDAGKKKDPYDKE
jgi:hypothetical protein